MLSVGKSNGRVVRCVVWSAPGEPCPDALARVLAKRGLGAVATDSPSVALTELCLAERAGVRSALIVCGVPDPERVLSASERFAPSSIVWIFEPGANPPLRSYVEEKKTRLASSTVRQNGTPEPAEPSRPAAELAAKPTPVEPSRERPAAPGLRIGRDTPDEQPATELKLAPGIDVPDAGRSERPRQGTVSARDVLEDAELEMLLAGERGTGDHGR